MSDPRLSTFGTYKPYTAPTTTTTTPTSNTTGRILVQIPSPPYASNEVAALSAGLGVSDVALTQILSGVRTGTIKNGKVYYDIPTRGGSLTLKNGGKVVSAAFDTLQIVKVGGKFFAAADIANTAADGVLNGVMKGNNAKTIASAIKVGVGVIGTAGGPKGAIFAAGVYLFDTVGMQPGQSRIEQMTEGVLNSMNGQTTNNRVPTPQPSMPRTAPTPR
jgi:hypothetical protein